MNSQPNREPSNLDMFIAEITGNGNSNFSGSEHQVSFRIQGHLHAQLTTIMSIYDMHAREKGRRAPSRNNVLNDLLGIALEAVYSRLGSDDKQHFDEIYRTASVGMLRYVEDEDMEDYKKEMRHEKAKHEKSKLAEGSNNEPV